MELVIGLGVTIAIVCGACGSTVASRKRAPGSGFIFGFLFGPLGVIAAGFLDNRPQCPRCAGPLYLIRDELPSVCQHCGVNISAWTDGGKKAEITDASNRPATSSGGEGTFEQLGKGAQRFLDS